MANPCGVGERRDDVVTAAGMPVTALVDRLPLAPAEVAGLVAALADAAAGLHAAGRSAGSLHLTAIALGPGGDPVMSSPPSDDPDGSGAEADMAALATLASRLLPAPDDGGDPWDRLRSGFAGRPRGGRRVAPANTAAAAITDAVRRAGPGGAAAVAAAVRAAVPEHRLPAGAGLVAAAPGRPAAPASPGGAAAQVPRLGRPAATPARRPLHRTAAIALAVAAGALAGGAAMTVGPAAAGRHAAPGERPPAPGTAAPPATGEGPGEAGEAATPASAPPRSKQLWPPVTVPSRAGGEVDHLGTTYVVGEPGDRVSVGDWDCDGSPTPALLRPDGSVWVFRGWASAGTAAEAAFVGQVEDAVDLAGLDDDGDGCPTLRVARRGQPPLAMPLEAP